MPTEKLAFAAIFDMDGLLVDTEPLHAEAFVESYRQFGALTDVQSYYRAVSVEGISADVLFESLGGSPKDWDGVKAVKDRLLARSVAKRGRYMPGVPGILRLLQDAGVPMALATSARRVSLEIVASNLQLTPYFTHLITGSDVAAIKPDPAGFLLASERLGVSPANCVVFEDAPKGIIAAHRAGMKSVAVPNIYTADGDFSLATLVVDSLERVDLQLLAGLWRA